jgi:hypothetical protein
VVTSRGRSAGLAAALVAGAMAAGTVPARADGTDEAGGASRETRDDVAVAAALGRVRSERAALRYREALAAVDVALALGRASPSQLVELYRTAGELAAGLDEPTSAQRWFSRWLALVPDGRLPDDASPKLRAPLAAARAEAGGRALTVAATPAADGSVRVTASGAPRDMVRAVRLRAADGAGPRAQGLPGAPLVPPAVAAGTTLVAAALDEHGNELVVRPVEVRRTAPGTARRPLYARWSTYAAGTAALATTGAVFAWRTAVAQDEFDRLRADSGAHTFEELEAVRRRGERHALVANLALGAAAATAVVTVVLAVRGGGGGGERAIARVPVAGADHAGVAFTGRF